MRKIWQIIGLYVFYRVFKKGYDMTQNQVIWLAKTLYGEARGEGVQGMQAVANVVMNRVKRGGWYGASVKDVVLKPLQFSCWNKSDPNFEKLQKITPEELKNCGALWLAESAVAGKLPDITSGATEYHSKNIRPQWNWDRLQQTAQIGNHVFYKGVA